MADVGTKLVKGKKQKSKIRKTFMRQPFSIIIFVLLVFYVISFLSPLIWAFICSFKSRTDFVLEMWKQMPFLFPAAQKSSRESFLNAGKSLTSQGKRTKIFR